MQYRPYIKSFIPAIFFGVLSTVMCLFTVWSNDAVAYTYFSPVFDESSTKAINSIRDIFFSQIDHYQTTNGRFVVHFIVQIFCALAGKTVFTICNGIAWFLLIFLSCRIANLPDTLKHSYSYTYTSLPIRNNSSSSRNWFVASLLWLIFIFLPADPAFQINYIWVAMALCGWILLFFKRKNHVEPIGYIILSGFYSLLCGSLHEGFSLALSFGICIFLIFQRFKFSPLQYTMAVAFGVGTLISVIAPGNFVRMSYINSPEDSITLITRILRMIENGAAVWALFVLLLFINIIPHKTSPRTKICRNISILTAFAAFAGLCISLKLGYFGRSALPCEFFMTLWIAVSLNNRRLNRILSIILFLIASGASVNKFRTQKDLNETTLHIAREYHNSDSGIVYADLGQIIRNPEEVSFYKWVYVKRERLENPQKPYITVRPELMRNPKFEKDTNMLVQLSPDAWLLYRSKTHPATFTVDKIILPGILDKKMSPRIINFREGADFIIDTIGPREVALYINRRPYIRSSVRVSER